MALNITEEQKEFIKNHSEKEVCLVKEKFRERYKRDVSTSTVIRYSLCGNRGKHAWTKEEELFILDRYKLNEYGEICYESVKEMEEEMKNRSFKSILHKLYEIADLDKRKNGVVVGLNRSYKDINKKLSDKVFIGSSYNFTFDNNHQAVSIIKSVKGKVINEYKRFYVVKTEHGFCISLSKSNIHTGKTLVNKM